MEKHSSGKDQADSLTGKERAKRGSVPAWVAGGDALWCKGLDWLIHHCGQGPGWYLSLAQFKSPWLKAQLFPWKDIFAWGSLSLSLCFSWNSGNYGFRAVAGHLQAVVGGRRSELNIENTDNRSSYESKYYITYSYFRVPCLEEGWHRWGKFRASKLCSADF